MLDRKKLGRCPFCIRWSAFLTVGAWGVVAAGWVLGVQGWFIGALVIGATLPTLLLLAHLFVLTGRVADRLEFEKEDDEEDGRSGGEQMSRRQFQVLALKWSVGAIAALALGLTPKGPARADLSCEPGTTFESYERAVGRDCERAQAKINAITKARKMCRPKCEFLDGFCEEPDFCKLVGPRYGQAQRYQKKDVRTFRHCSQFIGWVYAVDVIGCDCACRP